MAIDRTGIHALADALRRARRRHDRRADDRSQRDRPRADAAASAAARDDRRSHVYAVDGTPTDCVNIAITQVFKALPDLVVSGINKGWNLGDDVTYSGTVAGALEGALLGIPSIAVSLRATRGDYDFSHAARAAAAIAEAMLRAAAAAADVSQHQRAEGAAEGLSRHRAGEAQSRHVGRRAARSEGARRTTGSKKGRTTGQPHDRSDYQAVRDGYVSVTPLHPDLTAHDALPGGRRPFVREGS